ncbi:mammalian cell entry protein [Mycobacteroides chelonae]|nr:mammalian cell entry protein [Mycobacteroides chelonae]
MHLTATWASRRVRTVVQATAAALLAMTVAACDPPTLESLDLPAPSIGSDAYAVTAKFANALNLPDLAKVRLKGADIGEVESIEAIDDVAVVKLRILRGVRLPVGSTAQLRSATPLGDVFVALEPPDQPSGELLKDGDVLDLQTTSSAASVEGVLSSAAVLVNGGVVRNLTHLVNGLGKASADNGQTLGDIVGQSNQLLDTLNKRSAQIQNSLDKTSQLAASISSREKTINDLLAASGPGVRAIDANQIGDLANKSGQISDQLAKFPSIQGTDGRSTLADLNSISRGFNDIAVSPDTSLVALNRLIPMLIKANAGSAQAHDVNIAKLALGNIDDAGYKGSSDYHGPKQADWAYFVGSFKYTLYRLQERIVGQGPNPPAPQDSSVPPGR